MAICIAGIGALVASVTVAQAHIVGRTYRGNGGKTLPPIRLATNSTLFWSSGGAIFQIFSTSMSGGDVNSQAHKGWTYIPAGRYKLQVNADGNWAIKIVPGAVRPRAVGHGLIGYKGNGGLTLPPLRLPRSEQVYWSSSGALFQIFDSNFSGGLDVNSQGHRGSSYADGGTHSVTVNADGNWVIGWRP